MTYIETDRMCDYGCNHKAKYKLNNGKYCCSKSPNSCDGVRQKNCKIKLVDKVCPYCNTEFKQINGRVFSNHIRWCEKNPNHDKYCGEKFKEKISSSIKNNMDKNYGEYREFTVKCDNPKCKNHLIVVERENKFPQKEHYFCSIFCAHSFISSRQTDETKQKISYGVKNHISVIKCMDCGKEFEISGCVSKARCPECKKQHEPKYKNNTIKTPDNKTLHQVSRYDHNFELEHLQLNCISNDLSIKEISELRKKVYKLYRIMCSFTFAISDYPNEFNISLLEDVGMYSAKNHGDNQNGVSRDHMYSCADGFKNNISPLIISHPANCQLISQRNNASKNRKSSITLEQLLQRIKKWESKYGKYVKKNVVSIPDELFNVIKNAKSCHPSNYDNYRLIYE